MVELHAELPELVRLQPCVAKKELVAGQLDSEQLQQGQLSERIGLAAKRQREVLDTAGLQAAEKQLEY